MRATAEAGISTLSSEQQEATASALQLQVPCLTLLLFGPVLASVCGSFDLQPDCPSLI